MRAKRKGLNLKNGIWGDSKMETGKGLDAYFTDFLGVLRNAMPGVYSLPYRLSGRGFDRLRLQSLGEQSPRLSLWRFSFKAFVRSSLSIVAPIFLMGGPFGNPKGLPLPSARSVNPNGLTLPFDRGSGEELSQFALGLHTMFFPFGFVGFNAFARYLAFVCAVITASFGFSWIGFWSLLSVTAYPFGGSAL